MAQWHCGTSAPFCALCVRDFRKSFVGRNADFWLRCALQRNAALQRKSVANNYGGGPWQGMHLARQRGPRMSFAGVHAGRRRGGRAYARGVGAGAHAAQCGENTEVDLEYRYFSGIIHPVLYVV